MRKFLDNIKNDKKLMLIYWLIFVVILELTLFNFRFYQGLGYDKITLKDAEMDSLTEPLGNNEFHFTNDGAKITFKNINAEVKNIYFDINNTATLPQNPTFDDKKIYEEGKRVRLTVIIDDEGTSRGITMPERYIVSTVERTKYIPLNLSGVTNTLTLDLGNVANKTFKINSVAINKGVPFRISFIRVLVLFLCGILLYIIRPGSEFYKYRLKSGNTLQKKLIIIIMALHIVLMEAGCFINPMYVYNTVGHQNQYNELADAILDGHFYLNDVPDPKLAELDNPYDPEKRYQAGAYASWDHAYYNNKYYVYFGIVPALIFNIPAKLLFRKDIIPHTCILILMPVFVIMSYLLIYAIVSKFKDKEGRGISLLLYLMLTALFINSAGSVYIMLWPDLYGLPIFTALTLAVSGLYFWLSALRDTDGAQKLSAPRLLIGSLLLSLIAGARPQVLVILFIAIPLFWNAVFKERKLFSKDSIKQTLCFALPIALTAAFMCFYNYSRFGSVTEFGVTYNLTTNDITARGFMPGRLAQGIFSYILQPIALEGRFPYLIAPSGGTGFMGVTISEGSYGGILFQAPIIFILMLIPKLRKELKERGLMAITVMLLCFGILLAGLDSVLSGILSRYAMDFNWMFILASIMVLCAAYIKYEGRDYCNILNYCVPICFVISMLIGFGLFMGIRVYSPFDSNPETYWKIATAIQFWL